MHDWSQEMQLELRRRPELGSVTGVRIYDRSHIICLELGIRPKSRPPTRVGHMNEVTHTIVVVIYLYYKHV
jgi:hypothetical protein